MRILAIFIMGLAVVFLFHLLTNWVDTTNQSDLEGLAQTNENTVLESFDGTNDEARAWEVYQELQTHATHEDFQPVMEKYFEQFVSAKETAEEELLTIVKKAYEDYSNNNLSLAQIYETYYPKIESLELESDKTFYELFHKLEDELDSYGISKENMAPILDYYDEVKQEQKGDLLNQLQRYLFQNE